MKYNWCRKAGHSGFFVNNPPLGGIFYRYSEEIVDLLKEYRENFSDSPVNGVIDRWK
jgi:hypothetical protein